MKTTRSDKLRFAASVALGARLGFDLSVGREDGRLVVQVHSAVGISKADEDWFDAEYPHGCIAACAPSEWQDAIRGALTELAKADPDAAEHLSPAHDPRDGIDRIEGTRVMVDVGGYPVPISADDVRRMGAEVATAGVVQS